MVKLKKKKYAISIKTTIGLTYIIYTEHKELSEEWVALLKEQCCTIWSADQVFTHIYLEKEGLQKFSSVKFQQKRGSFRDDDENKGTLLDTPKKRNSDRLGLSGLNRVPSVDDQEDDELLLLKKKLEAKLLSLETRINANAGTESSA